MSTTFYDKSGNAHSYSDANNNIFDFAGNPVGYIYQDKIYSFDGRHLGWLINNWMTDNHGNGVLFSCGATGGPVTPAVHSAPAKKSKHPLPAKHARQHTPVRPTLKHRWSAVVTAANFFH
jgi:hypothetical protein